MAHTYKVKYFNFTARGEPIRMLLSYGEIPFEDERISREDWPKIKPTTPLGQLPVLEIDGKQIPHSISICRYLASVVKLDGKDAKENLRIDVAVETLLDLQKLAFEYVFESDAAKKDEKNKKLEESVPLFLGKLEEQANKNGGYTALDRLSWADIIFICIYEGLMNILGKNTFDSYPSLQKIKKNVLDVKGIRNWIKNRPETPSTMGPLKFEYDLKHEV
ncbi:glutathione S-transferase-like [Diabrotica undecimpunctata]|uniref:glutathione S-transferase-like n=1 Tax=Diabrotica undecimpunctata TaxID=50387 RepID=UPI003B641EDA